MSSNAALLKKYPYYSSFKTSLLSFVLFVLWGHRSEVKRVAQPTYRESIVVNGGEHCPNLPFRFDSSIHMLLGVLVANRNQLNSIPRLPFPQNSHLAQGHALLWGPAPIPGLVNVEGQPPCFKTGQFWLVIQVSEAPMGLAEIFLWLHHAQSFPQLNLAFL